jgi:hypothetical protein
MFGFKEIKKMQEQAFKLCDEITVHLQMHINKTF